MKAIDPDTIDYTGHNEQERLSDPSPEWLEDLMERTEAFVKSQLDVFRWQMTRHVTDVLSTLLAQIVRVVLGLMMIISFSCGVAIWIGDAMGGIHFGFLLMGAFYGLLILVFGRKGGRWIRRRIGNSILTEMLK
jgi:hypothetical protein